MRPDAAINPSAPTAPQWRTAVKPIRAACRWLAPFGLAASLSLAPMAASASFVYTYVGNNFTSVTGTGLTTSDHVVFEFETATAMGTGFMFLNPLAWQFTSGGVSFGSGDAGATLTLSNLGAIYLSLDSLGLDSICTGGQLAGKGSFVLNNGRGPGSMLTGTSCMNMVDNFDQVSVSVPSPSTGSTHGFRSFTVRERVQQPPSNALPEPATLALAGLAMLAAVGGRRMAWRRT